MIGFLLFLFIYKFSLSQGDLITYEELIKPINSHESWFGWGRRILISNPSKWALNFLYQTPALRRNFETEVLIDNRILKVGHR